MIMGISARSDIVKIWLYDWKKRMNTGKSRIWCGIVFGMCIVPAVWNTMCSISCEMTVHLSQNWIL